MYISVENYREKYLVGKDITALTEEIGKLRREIMKVKNKLESPAGAYDLRSYATESAAIDTYKGYLSAAIERLCEVSGEAPSFTEEEKASLIFDSTVDGISCVTLTVGRYLQDKYELSLGSEEGSVCEIHLDREPVMRSVDPLTAREVIRSLHMGDWKESYTPEQYGCTLNEPTKWQIRIDYNGGSAPRFFDGVGVFPYNFSTLCRLMGADVI